MGGVVAVAMLLVGVGTWQLCKRQDEDSNKPRNSFSIGTNAEASVRPGSEANSAQSNETRVAGQPIPTGGEDVPRTIQERLQDSSYSPRDGDVPILKLSAEMMLVERYRGIDSISNKFHLACILAMGGGEATVSTIAHTLTNEYSGKELTKREHMLMLSLPVILGRTAARCDAALRFLSEAACLDFWRVHCQWRSDQDQATAVEILAGAAAMGLGMSGRPEALVTLRNIRDQPGVAWPTSARGLVVDGVFRHAMVRQYGAAIFSSGEDTLQLLLRWQATPEASEWMRWVRSVDGVHQ